MKKKMFLLLLSCFMIHPAKSQTGSSIPTEGLVAFYPFNGNANDSSGNALNASVSGATLTADRFGVSGRSYSFNGSTSIIRCGDILDSVFSAPIAKFTVSGWAMTRTYGSFAGGGGFIIGKNGGGTIGPYQFNVTHDDGLLYGAVFSDTAAQNYIALTCPMTSNQWFHFALVFDGSLPEMQRVQLYVNGQSSFTTLYQHAGTLGTTTVNSAQQLTIGATHYANLPETVENNYDGNVDDFRIYNRALSASEIQSLYHEGGWTDTSSLGLVAYYPFNGNAGDSSGNGYNGITYNATPTVDRFGMNNGAYSFNGTTSTILCGNILDSVFAAPVAKFTVAGWARTRTYGTIEGGGGFIVGKNAGGGSQGAAEWNITHLDIGLYGAVFSDTLAQNYLALNCPQTKGVWFHFALVFDGSLAEMQRVKLFVNGVSSNTMVFQHIGTLGTSAVRSSQQVSIGASYQHGESSAPKNGYDGDVDDIRIYNRALSDAEIQSLYSLGGWPISTDTTLHAAPLADVYLPNAGSNPLTTLSFSSSGSGESGGTIDSVYWYVNGLLTSKQHDLTYQFSQGTSCVQLVVEDGLGNKASSSATVTISKFKQYLNGPVYAGPSLLGRGALYVIGTGDAIYRLDSAGNELYSLQVGGAVKSSSTIAFDTTVYIGSSDKNLYAFSKFGNEVWPPLAMGGALNSTPVIDSVTNQLYVGVSNKNFVAVDRSAGTVTWNYFADAPISSSAAITPDRKLIFGSIKGTVYGFDLANPTIPPQPGWQIPLYDTILASPAVDDEGFMYICTTTGKVYKLSMSNDEPASIVWQKQIGGSISSSPVIDGKGIMYAGSSDSKLYALNTSNGSIKWTYQSGSPILSTPAVSNIGTIYIGNHSGKVIALDSTGSVLWYYQDSASVDAPLLYDHGTLYVGTTAGRLLALYDGGDTLVYSAKAGAEVSTAPSIASQFPLWGTFHGDNQRTGVSTHRLVTRVSDNTTSLPQVFSLLQNYPNPFNPSTRISYTLPAGSSVTLKIYDVLGRTVQTLVNERQPAGAHSVVFDGSMLSSGVYFYRLTAGNFTSTKHLLLLK